MNEVTNLENSKKLHAICIEKGVEMSESRYIHLREEEVKEVSSIEFPPSGKEYHFTDTTWENNTSLIIPAYTTNELLEWIISTKRTVKIQNVTGMRNGKIQTLWSAMTAQELEEVSKTPQDALCLLLIELISKKLIK